MKSYKITKDGDEWILWDSKGEELGRHKTEDAAKKQEAAIKARQGAFEAVGINLPDLEVMTMFESGLRSIKDVEIFAAGTWRGSGSPPGGDKYTKSDLGDMVTAFDAGVVNPNIKITHGPDKEQVDVGKVVNLRVQGNKLIGDFVDMPSALYELMKKGLFKKRSAEVFWDLKDKAGKVWRRVVKAVALLTPGQSPAVSTLRDGYTFEAVYCYETGGGVDVSVLIERWTSWAGDVGVAEKLFMNKDGIEFPLRLAKWFHGEVTGEPYLDYQPEPEDLTAAKLVVGGILSFIDEGGGVDPHKIQMKEARIMAIEDLIKKYSKFGVTDEASLEAFLDGELDKSEKAQAEIKTFNEAKKTARDDGVKSFIETAKKDGFILPKEEDNITKQFDTLVEAQNDEGIENLKTFLTGLGKRVDFSEQSRSGEGQTEVNKDAPPAKEVDRLAQAYVSQGKAKTYNDALGIVQTDHKELWTAYMKKYLSNRR